MDSHTQQEHRLIAIDCWNVLKEVLPCTTTAFEKYYLKAEQGE
jgi:thymidylate synthase ThyX